jgi:hypothetical protein
MNSAGNSHFDREVVAGELGKVFAAIATAVLQRVLGVFPMSTEPQCRQVEMCHVLPEPRV